MNNEFECSLNGYVYLRCEHDGVASYYVKHSGVKTQIKPRVAGGAAHQLVRKIESCYSAAETA